MEWTGSPMKKLPISPFKSHAENCFVQKSPHKMEDPMGELLAKLHSRQGAQVRQKREVNGSDQTTTSFSPINASDISPASGSSTAHEERTDALEVSELRKQLEVANERVALANLQLTQAGLAAHTMEEAIGSPFPNAQQLAVNISGNDSIPIVSPLSFGGSLGRNSNPFNHIGFSTPQQGTDHMMLYARPSSGFGNPTGFTPPISPHSLQLPFNMSHGNMHAQHQAPIGTKLSPTAAEFGTARGQWFLPPQSQQTPNPPTYVNALEPTNYRRLLDRDMSCNWKYIVDKIVCNNDQQASIFLQQKLKIGAAEQKFEIVQAIINQAYSLMVNRFGNFLVQRCFEHGTPEQIVAIAKAIRGNTLNLSMDAFGCHVVQKAFDCVPEEHKILMVHELLRRIPETVIHRYACHVWQKLFELRWNDSPPQIMRYVNDALHGMWHEVALGETGSLVVQNIFENCLEEDKRPCINEVMASIDVIAHGQFGNWCIQHICEHGSIPDRTRAIDHVVRFATEYSTDQFASKVVEKCLKIGGPDFLDRYLERVCEADPDRPRMPLIDIAGDQFGNYLIQYILTNSDAQRRDIVATHVRKHMVSLRGSKYGSRVAMLCSNPALSTRPGPPAGMSHGRQGTFNDRYGPEFGRGFGSGRGFNGNFPAGFR